MEVEVSDEAVEEGEDGPNCASLGVDSLVLAEKGGGGGSEEAEEEDNGEEESEEREEQLVDNAEHGPDGGKGLERHEELDADEQDHEGEDVDHVEVLHRQVAHRVGQFLALVPLLGAQSLRVEALPVLQGQTPVHLVELALHEARVHPHVHHHRHRDHEVHASFVFVRRPVALRLPQKHAFYLKRQHLHYRHRVDYVYVIYCFVHCQQARFQLLAHLGAEHQN